MRSGAYTPQPGTIPHKVITYLQAQADLGRPWVPAAELAEHVGQSAVAPYLLAPMKHGAVKSRKKLDDLRLSEYALGDGKPLPVPKDHEPDEPLAPAPRTRRGAPRPPVWPATGKPTGQIQSKEPREEMPASSTPRRRGPAAGSLVYADVQSMEITNDPIVPRTAGGGDKYGPIFARMIVGQSIKCAPDDAPKVANALRKWRDANHPAALVRAVRHYPADNLGRVWLLPPAKTGKGGRA